MASSGEVVLSFPDDDEEIQTVDCHLVPCEIKFSGTSAVDKLFSIHPNDKEETPSEPSASFRGRQLKGKEITVPDGYKGVVLNQDPEDDENLTVKTYSGKITYWNWDKIPTKNDSVAKMMDWFRICNSIHGNDDE